MRTVLIVPLAGLLLAWHSPAQDPTPGSESRSALTPKEKVEAIDKEMNEARDEFFKLYKEAKTDEEKGTLFKEKYPKPENWFPKMFEIAKEDPKGEGALAALVWVVSHDQRGKQSGEALEILMRDHIASKELTEVAGALGYSRSPKAEEFLKTLEEKSPHREVKGRALYARAEQKQNLARTAGYIREAKDPEVVKGMESEFSKDELDRLRALDSAAIEKEIEDLFVKVKDTYGDVEAAYGGTLGDRAEGDLFEIRHLAIGKVAPEIEGEAIDGTPLKLSDYKGKVVVIDFWGHW
jgi:hypothetical protein